MGTAAILFNGAELFEQIVNTFQRKTPCEILWKLFKRFREDV